MKIIIKILEWLVQTVITIIAFPFCVIWKIWEEIWPPLLAFSGVCLSAFVIGIITGIIRTWGKI